MIVSREGARRALCAFVLLLAGWSIAPGAMADPTKHPSEWTPAERAKARRDPSKRLERVRALLDARKAIPTPHGLPPLDVIDGRRNPELFFVTELFEMLVRSSTVLLPDVYPRSIRQRGTDLFHDPAEWQQFMTIVRDYGALLKQEADAAKALDAHKVTDLQAAKCAAAARALREARQTFGRQRFDRMLYETVTTTRSYGWDTDLEKVIAGAQAREERCQ